MARSAASGLLSRQLKLMQSDKDIPGISCGLVGSNVFEWEVMLMISDDCKYYGGKAHNLMLFYHENGNSRAKCRGKKGKGNADDADDDVHTQEVSTAPTSSSPPSTPTSRPK